MKFLRQNGLFLTLCLLLIVALSVALGYIPKPELHLLLCDRHTAVRDVFYKYYTQVGEWFPYVVCVALLFYKAGWAVFTTAGTLLSGLVTQIIKRIVNAPRPVTYFADNYPDVVLPLVNGVHVSHHHSFPSGHTTTFFALFFALCIIGTSYIAYRYAHKSATQNSNNTPNNHNSTQSVLCSIAWQILCFVLATLGAYSRIYLSQHFAADILAGMCVGILITILLYACLHRCMSQKWWNWNLLYLHRHKG